ncbi:rod shape-determining protein MreC [Candidatus Kinetoplastibacterium oncopeltii TCC290E]|uniref:Cell shape-determining protein MreC n=1 Tax=Candidatus Kinetoplastidibacterium stringomonadis TCC290E TaxID=1208920 RepID=M1LSW5_9PROT|nr:rod shape-determining protein MreC [Candidatus Kinetoplastibacterium oncopeltii]AGF48637.1 rod shape-determining protein MreC [Candidatus Kinetoplastibacterium oncopeltii TCC290E]
MKSHDVPTLFRQRLSLELRLLFLMIFASLLLMVDSHYSFIEPFRRVVAVAIYPFQRIVVAPRDVVIQFNSYINAASIIRKENEFLQRQRIELAQVTTRMAQLLVENNQLRNLLGIKENIQQPSVVVEILYDTVNSFNRRLVFNKGSNSGILPGMPVINESGVVGQIIRVTPMTSEVALISDSCIAIPVQISRNGMRLISFGAESGKIEVRYLLDNVDIREGDKLITSGIGGIFPAGLPVAEITKIEIDKSTGYHRAVSDNLAQHERYRHFIVLQVDLRNITE